MGEIKYIIFVIIAFAFVGLFMGAGELWKKLKGVKKEGLEKVFKVLVVIVFLALIGLGIWVYNYQKAINLCEDKCIASFEGWSFIDPDVPLIETIFDSQEECIDFCQSILRDLQGEEWKSMDLKSIF